MELFDDDYEDELAGLKCRDYQKEALVNTFAAFRKVNSTMIVCPTGTGKTVTGGAVCQVWTKRHKGKVLWIAHRKELIDQAANKIESLIGVKPDVEMAEQRVHAGGLLKSSSVVVASIQSLMAGRKCQHCDGTGGVLAPCLLCCGEGCGDEKCEGRGTVATDEDCPYCLGGKIRRLQKFKPDDFGLVIVDECFPSTVKVSGQNISEIQVGDFVDSFNHTLQVVQKKPVTHVFKTKPKELVSVHFSSGNSIVCTSSHPFFVVKNSAAGDYIAAKNLKQQDMVYRISHPDKGISNGNLTKDMCSMQQGVYSEKLELNNDSNLLRTVQETAQRSTPNQVNTPLFGVRNKRRVFRENPIQGANKPRVLFSRMPAQKNEQRVVRKNGNHKQETRFRKNEAKQPDAECVNTKKSQHNIKRNRMEAANARRKWNRTNSFSVTSGVISRLGHGACGKNRCKTRKCRKTSLPLQVRYCKSSSYDRHRNRRTVARSYFAKRAGQKENQFLAIDRVDRVEIHKSTSTELYADMCPGGFVYNIEVEGNNNYFADGVLVHNCHHATSSTYRRVVRWFRRNQKSKLLGLTATPDRSDEAAMGQVFQTVAINIEMPWAIQNGWLVPITQQSITCEHLDFTNIRTTAGDLNQRDLEQLVTTEESLHEMVAPTVEIVGDRRTLCFCVDKMHTKMVCTLINRYKPNSAQYILGDTPKEEREQRFADHQAGKFQFLVNCGVTTEGYDDPGIQVVALMRPTKSRSLYAQMCGRGTRPIDAPLQETPEERTAAIAASAKPNVLILDYVGNSGRHKLITVFDLFAGHYESTVLDRAKRVAKEAAEELETDEAIKQAQQQLEDEEKKRKEESEAKRLEWLKAREVKYQASSVDPFGWWDTLPDRISAEKKGQPATENQIAALTRIGLETYKLANISESQASVILKDLAKRKEKGLCSYKQAKLLKKNGLNPEISFKQAGNIIDALARNNWRVNDTIRAMAPMEKMQ